MSEGGMYPEGSQIIVKEQADPEGTRSEAKQARQKLEQIVLSKGLIKRQDRPVKLSDGSTKFFEDYVVPKPVEDALKTDPVYKSFYGNVTLIQMLHDNSGQPLAEIRFWDEEAKREKAIHFSVGTSGRQRILEVFPHKIGSSPQLYFYDEDVNKPANSLGVSNPEAFIKIKPEIDDALLRLSRFPDKFKPTLRERAVALAGKVVPKR